MKGTIAAALMAAPLLVASGPGSGTEGPAAAPVRAVGGPATAAAGERTGQAHPEFWPASHSVGLVDPATEKRVASLLARLSLEEKVGQVIQADIASIRPEDLRRYPLGSVLAGGSSPPLGADDRSPAPAWIATARAFRAVSLEARPGHVPVPVMFGIDAVHGNSNVVGATVFPHNVGLGAMHDPALMRRIGEVTAEESAASGIDWAFGPTLAVPQDVRWGRAYEGYSEDPALVRGYAGEMVRGLQGDVAAGHLLQKGRVAASAKHFLGDGGTRGGVDQGDADIDERELIDTHAQGYLAAIPAGTLTVMASFSGWQGHKMHGNESLLTGVLKGRLGFEGFVVGDWNGHGQMPGCTPGDCPAAINAGLDMFMAPDHWRELFDATLAEARDGRIPMARLDDAVRRILRVKAKLGLLEPGRPWEGRLDAIGSPAHRAVARQAVRESLVLLKNERGLLPLRSGAHVLVAGAAADDIGRLCGGWTLSWQGTGNHNSDFPNGESILAGLRTALGAGGGSVEFSADGTHAQRADVAVVVYGETPYAELQGDVRHLEFQPGEHADLALLRRLKAEGIPVVSVFLSGRPMWMNAELNASDAFVAAWFPGSEGGGVADVLVGTAEGKPRHPFTGSLSFSWPRRASQAPLHKGVAGYDPLFPVGFGLRYGQHATLAPLPEESDVAGTVWNVDRYFQRGRTQAPWEFRLAPEGGIAMRAVDAGGVQEAGRSFSWSGTQPATLAIAGAPVDLSRQANAELVLRLEYRVDRRPAAPVQLAMGCTPACAGAVLDVTPVFADATPGEWHELKVKLGCLVDAGVDMSAVSSPVVLTTAGAFEMTLLSAALSTDGVGATCPARAQPR
jgi:beta-glucosidase